MVQCTWSSFMSRARHSRHVELALHAGKTVIIATSRQPTLVEAYLTDVSQQPRVLAAKMKDLQYGSLMRQSNASTLLSIQNTFILLGDS